MVLLYLQPLKHLLKKDPSIFFTYILYVGQTSILGIE